MANFFDENILNDILSRINIVEVIAEYIPLKRAGRNFKTTCPFHHEKTPSFMVSPDKQIYHCFGCSAGGNVFNFLMQYQRMEFPEVVALLARKAGVVLPQRHESQAKAKGETSELYKANDLAALFYSYNLNSAGAQPAVDYLVKRGIKKETAKLFRLGFAADKWEALINHLREKSISLALMEKAGLVLAKSAGGYYDRFRKRIIFPIFDIKSAVVGFGARVLDDSLPKYVNSPETPIYTKGRNLYGINLAKDAARDADSIVMVEGYLDCITPYQEGLHNIVASSGTALTREQARLIKRYSHNVVMVYDGDLAGQLATLRSLDIFIEEEMQVKVVSLPEGYDPDSFVRKKGIAELKAKIAQAENLFDYKLGILKGKHSLKEAEGKAKIVSEMLPMIKKFKNNILVAEYIKKLSQELRASEADLYEELKKVKEEQPYLYENISLKKELLYAHPTEKLLIKLMLEETELIAQIKERLDPADFQGEITSRVVSTMFELVEQGKTPKPNALISSFSDENVSQLICESTFLPESSSENKEKVVDDCIQRLKKKSLCLKRQKLLEEIKKAESEGDENRLDNLKHEFNLLIKEG